LLVLAPLFFARWTVEGFTYNKAALMQLTALALVALAGPARSWGALRGAVRDPAALGALLFGLSAAISTDVSVSPRTSLQGASGSFAGLGVALAYVVVFFAGRAALGTPGGVRVVCGAAGVAAAGTGAYAALQAAGLEAMGWDGDSRVGGFVRPFGTLGHPNLLGAYLAVALPLVLSLAARAMERGRRGAHAVWLFVAGLAGAGVVASLSRAAWLAAACGLAVAAAGGKWRPSWRKVTLALFLAAAGAAACSAVWGGSGLAAGLGARLRALADGGGRPHIWRTAWLVFRDHPWFGSGLDTFQLVFGSRQTADYWHVEWGFSPAKAHNEVLHTLATQGLCGALALLAWGGGLVAAAVRAWRRGDAGHRPACVAVVAALVAFVVQAQFGFVEPGCGTLAACLAGLLAGLGDPREATAAAPVPGWPVAAGAVLAVVAFAVNLAAGVEPFGPMHLVTALVVGAAVALALYACRAGDRPGCPPRAVPAVAARFGWPVRVAWAAVAAGLGFFGVVRPYLADCHCQAGEMARGVDPAAELREHRQAVALAPDHALYWTKLAAAAKDAAACEPTAAGRLRLLREASRAADRAAELVPADPAAHANRGRVLADLAASGHGDADAAFAEFDAAIAASPRDLLARADAGQAALACGRPGRARRYFEAGLSADASFARFAAGLAAVALSEGRADEALGWLERTQRLAWYEDNNGCEGMPGLLAAAHLAAGHPAAAANWARAALAQRPGDAGLRRLLSAALDLDRSTTAAAREGRAGP
jgi:O-antigen ligase